MKKREDLTRDFEKLEKEKARLQGELATKPVGSQYYYHVLDNIQEIDYILESK